MKRGTPRHPKLYDLMQALGLNVRNRAPAIGYLELLWHFTAEFAPQGDVGRFTDARLEAAMDWTGKHGKLIESLTTSGWCDVHNKYRLVVHDWHDHADDATRKKLIRLKLPFVTVTAKVTGLCRNTDRQFTTTQVNSGSLPEPLPLPEPEPLGRYTDRATPEQIALREALERMYNLHPKKKDFGGVLGALGRASSNGTTLGQIEERHAAWCRHGEWIAADKQKYVPTLTKWLEDRGFTQWPPGHQKAEQPKRYICPEAEPEP